MVTRRAKHAIKLALASGLYYSGLLSLWRRVALRHRAVVLMYHRVLSDGELAATGSHPGIVVRATTFARQMELLRKQFVVLSPDEFARRIAAKEPFESCSCLITFDDGWRDTLTQALPVLRAHDLPALVFLPVNYIGSGRIFWREAVTSLMVLAIKESRRSPARRAQFEGIASEAGFESLLANVDADPRSAISEVLAQRKDLDLAIVNRLIAALATALDLDARAAVGSDGFISWPEAADMTGEGITFGGHGAEHRLLTHVPAEEARLEIEAARDVISRELAARPTMFSYPNGNWTPAVADMVRAAGFTLAFSTRPGSVSCDDEPYSLRRVNVHEDATSSPALFMARLVGLF